jgi:hypothetical protein
MTAKWRDWCIGWLCTDICQMVGDLDIGVTTILRTQVPEWQQFTRSLGLVSYQDLTRRQDSEILG